MSTTPPLTDAGTTRGAVERGPNAKLTRLCHASRHLGSGSRVLR